MSRRRTAQGAGHTGPSESRPGGTHRCGARPNMDTPMLNPCRTDTDARTSSRQKHDQHFPKTEAGDGVRCLCRTLFRVAEPGQPWRKRRTSDPHPQGAGRSFDTGYSMCRGERDGSPCDSTSSSFSVVGRWVSTCRPYRPYHPCRPFHRLHRRHHPRHRPPDAPPPHTRW